MDTTELTERDRAIITILKRLGDSVDPSFLVRQAVANGASPALVEYCANRCLDKSEDGYTCMGLAYVPVIVELYGREFAREFVERMCLSDQHNSEDAYHREGFWRDQRAWDLYDNVDILVKFILKLAKYDAARILSHEVREQIVRKLATLRSQTGELEQLAQSNQTELILIESMAVHNLDQVRTEYQLQAVLRQSRKEQLSCAARVYSNGWNLVLIGYVMATHSGVSEEARYTEAQLYRYLESYPDKAVAVYRWLAEGFHRAVPEYWEQRIERSYPRRMLETQGWMFIRLSATPQGYLQARIPGGAPLILRHQSREDEIPLKAGDEVMFHPELLTGLVPKNMPGMQIFTLSLPPAAPPPTAALANEMGYFYAGYRDDVLVDPYRTKRKTVKK